MIIIHASHIVLLLGKSNDTNFICLKLKQTKKINPETSRSRLTRMVARVTAVNNVRIRDERFTRRALDYNNSIFVRGEKIFNTRIIFYL